MPAEVDTQITPFADRQHAGQMLARRLAEYANRDDVLVLALPRGGVPVAFEVAAALGAPLDVFTVRKIGAPWNEEFAIGAIASGGIVLLDRPLIEEYGIALSDVDHIVAMERREMERRDRLFRGTRPFPDLTGKTVIVVDDGLATGASMLAAVDALKARRPQHIIAAAPVGSVEACRTLTRLVDRCVCVFTPEPFYGVGMWYEDFEQTSDAEVILLLERARGRGEAAGHGVHAEPR